MLIHKPQHTAKVQRRRRGVGVRAVDEDVAGWDATIRPLSDACAQRSNRSRIDADQIARDDDDAGCAIIQQHSAREDWVVLAVAGIGAGGEAGEPCADGRREVDAAGGCAKMMHVLFEHREAENTYFCDSFL